MGEVENRLFQTVRIDRQKAPSWVLGIVSSDMRPAFRLRGAGWGGVGGIPGDSGSLSVVADTVAISFGPKRR